MKSLVVFPSLSRFAGEGAERSHAVEEARA